MRLSIIAGILPGLLLAGCADAARGLPETTVFPSPEDPSILGGTPGRAPVVGAYTHRTVREPAGFRGTGVDMAPVAGREPAL